ncbi:MAG: oligosaccharide flippase family protein [Nitriliruptorales bacterium]
MAAAGPAPGIEGAVEILPEGVLKHRAKAGVFFVGSWGAINLLVGFFGNIALARMLLPRDFGIVAIGATLLILAGSVSDGGLAGGLIRRERAPDRGQLRTALGLQLTLTAVVAVAAASVGGLFGGSGLVVALMMAALPIAALQMPGRVMLSRGLRFRMLATVDSCGVLAYYAWAISGVLGGLGVWALASAFVVRAFVAALGVIAVSGLGVLLPSYRGAHALRPVIRFGLRFQAVGLTVMARDQGLNTGIATIAGVTTLGLWSLARRLLELPLLMFEPLHRVSLPLMSQMLAARRDPARLLGRGVAVAGTLSGVVLVSMAAAAPELVPAVFGEQWRPVGGVVQWVCAAFLITGPLSVVGVGYLYAVDAPSAVLRATILHTTALFAVAFALLPVMGLTAVGIGAVVGATVEAAVVVRAIRERSTARPLAALIPTLAVAALAGVAGTAVTIGTAPGLLAGLAGGLTAAGIYVALLMVFRRAVVTDTLQLVGDAVRSGLSREAPPAGTHEAGQRDAARPATAS